MQLIQRQEVLGWHATVKLVKYKWEFGNRNVPVEYKRNGKLGEQVQWQSQRFKNKSLSEECINKLNQIGFVWTIYENAWLARYNKLLDYMSTFEDFSVPKIYNGERSLASWVCQQRLFFKNKTLSESYIAKLNEVGCSQLVIISVSLEIVVIISSTN